MDLGTKVLKSTWGEPQSPVTEKRAQEIGLGCVSDQLRDPKWPQEISDAL